MQDIQTEFHGPIPSPLSAYYRKTVQSEMTANLVDQQWEFDCLFNSEIGNHPSTFENEHLYFSSDFGTFIPRGYLAEGISYPTVATYGKVWQGQGTTWGGINQPRTFGPMGYFKLEPGATYNFSTRRRLLDDPTNSAGNAPYQIMGFAFYGADFVYNGGMEVIRTQMFASQDWQTLTASRTYADIIAAVPNAIYARWYSYDNVFDFTDPGSGSYNYYVTNQTTQIASIGVTKSSGSFVGIGFTRIYDKRNETVWDRSGTTWAISATETYSNLGVRNVTNPYTGKVFNVGDFYVVDRPYNQNIPMSGPISFSDFLGQKRAEGPIWQTPSDQGTKYCNDPINITVNATSEDGLTISYREVDLPSNFTLNPTTGQITGNIIYINSAFTYQGFTIVATDGFLTTSRQFNYQIINRGPTWNTPASLARGTTYSIQFSATDPEGQGVKYLLASGAFPPGATFTPQGLLSGTAAPGVYTFELAANDNFTSTFRTFTLTLS